MGKINVILDPSLRHNGEPILYYVCKGKHAPQDVFIFLDEDGRVGADFDSETNGSIPVSVRNNCMLRFCIPPDISGFGVYSILTDKKVLSLLQTIHDGHKIEQAGHARVGKLTDEAYYATGKLQDRLDRISHQLDCRADVRDPKEYYAETALKDLMIWDFVEDAAEELVKYAAEESIYFADGAKTVVNYLKARIEEEKG